MRAVSRIGTGIFERLFAGHRPWWPINIRSDFLTITGGGQINTITYGHGDAGNVNVTASRLRIDADGFTAQGTGIFTYVGERAIGRGGDIDVESASATITSGGQVNASTFGRGDSGSISISATKFRIDGLGSDFGTGIFTDVGENAVGHGGDVIVHSDHLAIISHGQINANTFGRGDGGRINCPR